MSGKADGTIQSLEEIRQALGDVRERLARPPAEDAVGLGETGFYFRRLLDVSRRMTSTFDLKQVLDVAIETLVELFAAEKGFLIVLDDEGNLEFDVAVDAADGGIEEASGEVSRSILEEVVRGQAPVLVGDALEDDRFKDKTSVRSLGLRSAMCVPLTGREGVVGAIYVDHRAVAGRFSKSDLELLSLFGNQVAIAIENARLFEEQARRARGMELLYSLGHAALERPGQETMVSTMLDRVSSGLFADGALLLVAESEGSAGQPMPPLVVRVHAGLDQEFVSAINGEAVAELATGGAGSCTADELPAGDFRERCQAEGISCLAAASLDARSEERGFLLAVRREESRFTEGDLELLRVAANEARLVLRNLVLYQQLQETNEELRQAREIILREERLRALGTMASGIAHDINNVLTPVLAYSDVLLADEQWTPEARRKLRILWTCARDIAGMVTRLREFYRKRDREEPLKPVAVAGLFEQTLALTRPHWHDAPQRRGAVILVEHTVAPGLPPVIGDEIELREAMANLILNAVDAMSDGGNLTLRARSVGGSVEIQVSDSGTGMTEAVRRQCFEPFFTTKSGSGTGMGTSVVHGIIRRHNGEISVDSAPGKGTTFTILLPVASAEDTEPVPAAARPEPSRILCIDDESAVRRCLKEALVRDGHTVEVADGGQAGIDAFAAGGYDVVVTDLGMPNVDGRRVAEAVKKASPGTPVVLLTGWGPAVSAEGDLGDWIDVALGKPFTVNDLRGALLQVLGPREESDEG